ncbi:GntR family transcriptional regulator [Limnochorda pilosa]|uniref:Transcriptional regulator n=1 Tax=Limnochorda pilosa TaxID=1555112 RepID=A0A0K2SM65_LIMPI|nr:GntR family transcriptional regulator [Limnochorda pilosa]BAS28195.1 transcriptional regulator [Limnochorda pilosa]
MSRNRVEYVYNQIRQGILDGEYSPSQHLVETHLAETYDVGRHIVRLALERLSAEGLVTIGPNRGAIVSQLTLEDVVDILLAREVLEGAAARLAAERISQETLDDLNDLLDVMREAIDKREFDRYSQTNVRFHGRIYEASGSKKIPELIRVLRARVVRSQFRTILVPGRAEKSLEEHRAIVEAFRTGDGSVAEEAMRAHIAALRETITESWELVRS